MTTVLGHWAIISNITLLCFIKSTDTIRTGRFTSVCVRDVAFLSRNDQSDLG